jgi:hypothetical protein
LLYFPISCLFASLDCVVPYKRHMVSCLTYHSVQLFNNC